MNVKYCLRNYQTCSNYLYVWNTGKSFIKSKGVRGQHACVTRSFRFCIINTSYKYFYSYMACFYYTVNSFLHQIYHSRVLSTAKFLVVRKMICIHRYTAYFDPIQILLWKNMLKAKFNEKGISFSKNFPIKKQSK